MLKPRNIIATLLLGYVALLVFAAFLQNMELQTPAQQLTYDVTAAADAALTQAQAVDDAFNGSRGYGDNSNVVLKAKVASGTYDTNYQTVDLLPYYFGDSSKQSIFEDMFAKGSNRIEFNNWVKNYGYKITQQYFDINKLRWIKVSKVARMGVGLFDSSTKSVLYGVSDPKFLSDYDMNSYVHAGGYLGNSDYYYMPQNLGLTYVNKDLVSFLFMNNMDLIMRCKYANNTTVRTPEKTVLTGLQCGSGVVGGSTLSQNGSVEATRNLGYINNGYYAIQRGTMGSVDGKRKYMNRISTSEGSNVSVQYKVINIFDRRNDPVLMELFGSNLGGYTSKADMLRAADTSGASEKDIIVAKVTFKLDVIVPFSQPTVKAWADQYGVTGFSNNLADLKRDNGIPNSNGTAYIYTRLFAVTP